MLHLATHCHTPHHLRLFHFVLFKLKNWLLSNKHNTTNTCTHTHIGDTESPESTWPNLKSPHRKKDKDVFRFLSKQSDTNYTVRRHQLQMSRILEKNQHVKKVRRGGEKEEEEEERERQREGKRESG